MAAEADPIRLTGGCQCGAIRYALSAKPRGAAPCHCRMCQKASGAPFMVFAGVPTKFFAFTRGAPTIFQSSDIAERGFCNLCGTPLTYRLKTSERISITVGSLDDPEAVAPNEQHGVESKLSWTAALDTLPTRRTQDFLQAAKITDVGNHQHPDHDTD
jgi:hypothetical protein